MIEHFYAVIMAGGGGTRLWPVSRRENPKQLLRIIENESLIRIAVDRLRGLMDSGHIFVVSIEEQITKLKQEIPEIPIENFLIEPMPKGTASVVGMAAAYLQMIDKDSVMAVLTADHVIGNVKSFHNLLANAKIVAEKGCLVTLGIEPTFPATGYGYINAGKRIPDFNGYHVKEFVEKPDYDTAKDYIRSRSYYWNSGMFIWQASTILEEFKKQMPGLNEKLQILLSRISPDGKMGNITDIWETIDPQTIDYGIMEGASNTIVLPAIGLDWIDVGSWDSLFELFESDSEGNVLKAKHVENVDSRGNLIYSTDSKNVVAVVGLKDIIIVDHQNTLLVCKKGETQKIRQIINQLKDKKLDEYL